jgi:hypothetical protein
MDMQKLSREEIQAEVTAAAIENRVPFADRVPAAPAASASPAREGIFTAADLTGAVLERSERYEVPGTDKALYVFPISTGDYQLLVEWATHLKEDDAGEEGDLSRKRLRVLAAQHDLFLFQVILCCRTGPTRASARCFSRGDHPALKNALGYSVIQEIARISDQLSGNDEAVGPGVRRFFGAFQTALRSWLSASSGWEGCPAGLREASAELSSLASAVTTHGNLASGTLHDLERLHWPA